MRHRLLVHVALWSGLSCAMALYAGACHQLYDGELTKVHCEEEGAYGAPACPAEHTCVNGTCVPGEAPLGAPCNEDADCAAPAFCLDPGFVGALPSTGSTNAGGATAAGGTGVGGAGVGGAGVGGAADSGSSGDVEAGRSFCSLGCCNSFDCGPADSGLVCWPVQAAAGQVCVPAEPLQIDTLGIKRGGEACMSAAECRSGQCEEDACVDVCCTDAFCTNGSTCALADWPVADNDIEPWEAWQCAPPEGMIGPGMPCNNDGQCSTGLCLQPANNMNQRLCAEPCCSMHDCSSTHSLGPNGDPQPLICAPPEGTGANPEQADFNACSKTQPEDAEKVVGETCQDDDECFSGLCLEFEDKKEMRCSDVCCRDEDCGDLQALACRPLKNSTVWALRCVPR